MALLSLADRDAVLRVVSECEALGREAFLAKHGFGKAREYFLLLDGKHYDSKAIAGVAYGYEHPNEGPLSAAAFSGGENTVRRVLQQLGFTVVKGAPGHSEPGALVLVENEVTVGGEYDFWADDTGARYQFPNQYRNRVRPGLPFVYYRGVRRSGGKRGAPEYFGAGVIGEVWVDPEQHSDTPARNRRWYCAIEEYQPFHTPVAAKHSGKPYESIKTAMGWRTGVREITSDVFNQVLAAAHIRRPGPQPTLAKVADATVNQAEPSEVLIKRPMSGYRSGHGVRPPSRELKRIGDWAEELVYRWLFEKLETAERDTLDWVAQRGETPGWDIAYTAVSSTQIHVEVKSTTLGRFSGIDVTGNEWQAATSDGENYVLALVTKAMSLQPNVALLWNPAQRAADGSVEIEPTGFRLIARGDA
jgi:hypothetical protein